jgi:Nucleolar protein,Nop52
MHDSKNQLSVQKLISTLASTFQTFYSKDIELQSQRRDDTANENDSERRTNERTHAQPSEQWTWLSRWHFSFWETLCREWPNIDQWRINKYLLLIRFVVREIFSIVYTVTLDEAISHTQAEALLESQIRILQEWPLSSRERKVPDGLRLHVLDVWIEELDRAQSEAGASAQDSKGEVEGSKKRKRDVRDDAGKAEKRDEATDAKIQDDNNNNDGDAEDAEDEAQPTLQKTQRIEDETTPNLTQLIRLLAKESISKSVRTKAMDITRNYDEGKARS